METESEFYKYSTTVLSVLGIIGNILVIISILKQRCLLRNNYYVLVLQLATCDLAALIFYLSDVIVFLWAYWPNKWFHPDAFCVSYSLSYVFKAAGIGMMFVISVLRYRATKHPLKPAISRRKLKVVCGLVYIVGFILGCVTWLPFCFVWLNFFPLQFRRLFLAIVYYLFPSIFMVVVYYKVGRALFKQSKHMKRLCHADAVKKRHIRDRRTFLICLTTVLCYGIGNLPLSALYIVSFAAWYHSIKILPFVWFHIISRALHYTFSFAANPVIYGILDKQLRTFWKCRKPNTRRSQEQEQFVQQVGETPL